MKFVIALVALTGVLVGCSSKADVGDAEVKIPQGKAKTPGAPVMGGNKAPGAGGGPAASAASPNP